MYWAILIIVNIPLFLFFAWIFFDTKDKAADTFFETIVSLLKIIFVPRIIRVAMGDEGDDAIGMLTVAMFFIACAFVVWGEHYLISKFFLQP